MSESRINAKKIKAAERHTRALQLRRAGWTYRRIGEDLGCSTRRARDIVDEEFAKLKAKQGEEAEGLRGEVEHYLRRILLRTMPLAAPEDASEAPDLKAAETAMRALERLCRLHGLDAPAKQVNVTAELGEMSQSQIIEELGRHGVNVEGLS